LNRREPEKDMNMIEINKVLITGRLTQDPVLKYIPSGTAVCELRIASDRKFVDKSSGDRRDDTLFINVNAWGKTAEFCNEWLRKGSAVFVEGRLRQETWKDKDGNNRERISISADRVQFAESKAEAQARGARGGEPPPDESNDREPAPRPPAAARSGGPPSEGGSETRDDLPF
jgi:single-strand DNA-binding protein